MTKSTLSHKKVLFISKELIAADLAYTMKKQGCDVKLFIENDDDKGCFNGMVEKTNDWKNELSWVGTDGLIIFDDVGYGETQDKLRAEGYLVIGGSADGDRLEQDREYGQKILKQAGVDIKSEFETYTLSPTDAISYIQDHKGSWTIKSNAHNTTMTYISCLADGSDAIETIALYKERDESLKTVSIQKTVYGIELAVGRFFNGSNWVGPIVFNREHKHVNNDDIGPLGGETGTVMWYEENEDAKLYKETLAKLKPHLQESGYRGYIDINCIIDEEGVAHPLEITSRFGSSTNQLQSEIHISPWFDFFYALATSQTYELNYKKGIGLNVAITTPPFPYILGKTEHSQHGAKIYFKTPLTTVEMDRLHFEDVALVVEKEGASSLYIEGHSGYILYVTSVSDTIENVRKEVYEIISKIHIPKMLYRSDIGLRFMREDYPTLQREGWV